MEIQSTSAVIALGLRSEASGLSTIAACMPSSGSGLSDGSIQTQHLADSAVTTAKLADGAVTTAKIAGNAVTTAQIADSSVGSAKIIDGSIGPQDLADGAVTKAKLSATGGTSGQVLGTDGTSLTWQTPSGGGGVGTLTLPYSGSASTAASTDALYVSNTGSGRAIQGSSVSDTAVFGLSTSGVGMVGQSSSNDGVVGRAQASGKSGVWGTGTSAVGVTGTSSGSDGVVGLSTSTDSGHAGVDGRNTGSGPAVFADGSLYVTGPFIGNIGVASGTRFPRPAYDSGWQEIHGSGPRTITLDPGLPVGNYDNKDFVIDMQTLSASGLTTNASIGLDRDNDEFVGQTRHDSYGVWYRIETDNKITVVIADDEDSSAVRVRVWVYR